MTPKQTALRNTLVIFGAAAIVSIAVIVSIVLFTPAQIGITLMILGILWLIKMFYDSEVERLEILERLDEKRETYNK